MIAKMAGYLYYIYKGTTMGYSSVVFFVCVLFFLLVYFLMRRQKPKMIWILIANLVFYVWAGGKAALLIVLATAVITYLASRKMEHIYEGYDAEREGLKPREQTALFAEYKKKTRKFLWLALALIILVWVYVKVGKLLDFDTVESFRQWISVRSVIVPLGISYYSLSTIGYLLDVFWRKTKVERNFLGLFTAMTYFPHIVQGPISKYGKLISQLHELPSFDYERVCFGLQLMLWGYIKKLLIADRLAMYTNTVFADTASYAGMEVAIAVFLSAFQLYADFSGCMDIVRGISQAIGIELDVNFRQPFFSRSAAEFWRRWHITLGGWTKEYMFMPIAVNSRFMKWTWNMKKEGKARLSSFLKNSIPLLPVWVFTGIWHGTGMDYLLWGLYWCGLMILSQETKSLHDRTMSRLGIDQEKPWYQTWLAVRTFVIFMIGRMFTVVGGLSGCALLWKQLFSRARLWTLFDGSLYTHGLGQKDFYIALLGIIIMIIVDVRHEQGHEIRKTLAAQPLVLRWIVYIAAMFAIVIFGIYGSGYNASAFVYEAF